jgi:hypothetical protein
MAEVVTFNGSREELVQLMNRLPAILSGQTADPLGIARSLQLRLGVALLSKVQQAFITKSRGGTGEDGIRWAPLTRATIAGRRATAAEKRAAGVGGRRVRGLLTPAQDRKWRAIFATRRARLLLSGMSPGAASARAASIAWAVLKGDGAQTRLQVFGGRQVDTLRDTGELFRSLSPGAEDKPSGADGQLFDVIPGRVIVGTNKKTWHHRGVPGRLPARPLWPLDGQLPQAWWSHLLSVYRRGLAVALVELLRRAQL